MARPLTVTEDLLSRGVGPDRTQHSLTGYVSLASAVASAGDRPQELIIDTIESITENITIPANISLRFWAGGRLRIAAGATVTFNDAGQILAGPIWIFEGLTDLVLDAGDVHCDYGGDVYAEWFGAIGDGATDDTAALQAALNSGVSDVVGRHRLRLLGKTYKFSQLLVPAQTTIEGIGHGQSLLERTDDADGTAIEDAGNAAKINMHDFNVEGKGRPGTLLKLGYNDHAWGTAGKLSNLWLREAAVCLDVNGNVGFIENVAVNGLTDAGQVIIAGAANLVTGLTHAGAAAYGIDVQGVGTLLINTHCEGEYTSASIKVSGELTQFAGVIVTVGDGETLPAVIEIQNGKYGTVIQGLTAYAMVGGTITALVVDDHYGTGRTLVGEAGSCDRYRWLPQYWSGNNPNIGWSTNMASGENWKGDQWLKRQSAYGEPHQYVTVNQGTPGDVRARAPNPGAIAKTSNETLDYSDDDGCRFSNRGAGGQTILTLPAAEQGRHFEFIKLTAQNFYIDPDGTEIIRGGGAGKQLRLQNQGDWARLMCFITGTWEVQMVVGTANFEG